MKPGTVRETEFYDGDYDRKIYRYDVVIGALQFGFQITAIDGGRVLYTPEEVRATALVSLEKELTEHGMTWDDLDQISLPQPYSTHAAKSRHIS